MTAPKLPLSALKGLGPARIKALGEAGVRTIYDLLMMLPVRYKDTLTLTPIADLRPGQTACVQGGIDGPPRLARFQGHTLVTARLRDETGKLRSLHDAGVTELQSAIDAARASSENGAAALHEECQSLAGAFSQGNNSLIQMVAHNQETMAGHLGALKQEYDKKYKLLLAVTAANLLGIAFFLWRVFR